MINQRCKNISSHPFSTFYSYSFCTYIFKILYNCLWDFYLMILNAILYLLWVFETWHFRNKSNYTRLVFIPKYFRPDAFCMILDINNDYFSLISWKIGDVRFRRGELAGCVELCEYFHNSTIELSAVVRRKYKLYNYVTPASYLELNRY